MIIIKAEKYGQLILVDCKTHVLSSELQDQKIQL